MCCLDANRVLDAFSSVHVHQWCFVLYIAHMRGIGLADYFTLGKPSIKIF